MPKDDSANRQSDQYPNCESLDETNRALIEAGAALHWLHPRQKRPIADEWTKAPRYTVAQLVTKHQPGNNIGLRTGQPSRIGDHYLHVIDLDVRAANKAAEAWAALLDLCPDARGLPSVVSGSGGESRHLYFLSETPMGSRKLARSAGKCPVFDRAKGREVRKHEWEIDLKGTGTQLVLPPSIHPDTGQPYRWERLPDLDWPLMWTIDSARLAPPLPVKSSTDLSDLLGDDRKREDPARVRAALAHIPDFDDRETWLHVGMGLHHEYGGDSPVGKSLWDEWSKQSEKFDAKDQDSKWKGFGKRQQGKPITLGTIIDMAKKGGFDPHARDISDDVFEDLGRDKDSTDLTADGGTRSPVGIIRTKSQEIKATLHNAIMFLRKLNQDEGYSIRYNEMSTKDEWRAGPINDADLGLIRVAIEQAGMHNVGADLTAAAVRAVAQKRKYHPLRDWLNSLNHDRKSRLDTWLTDYLGIEDSPYTRAIGRAFLIAMVARVMKPGCKADHVLTLTGPGGIGKSTACAILGGEWFGDNMPSIREGGKEAGIYLPGHWLIELAELAPSRKADAEDLKSFISRRTDEIRRPYDKVPLAVPRQCVFVGTTNEAAFLRDMTGGRRFWPVTCGTMETEALARDREQLFAEAVAAFRAGEAWHLSPEMERLAAARQEDSRDVHPWEEPIRQYLESPTVEGDGFDVIEGPPREQVSIIDLLLHLGIPPERHPGRSSRDVAAILRMMGWSRRHTEKGKAWRRGK